MAKRVILVHGFNVSDGGEATIDRLILYLEATGYEVIQYDYGRCGLLCVRFMSGRHAKGLMGIFQPGDIVIGHSNGGHLIARAIDMGMPVKHAIMIHPALDKDWHPPDGHPVKEIHVYWSPQDKATWWSQFSPWMWGGMGTYGSTSGDLRMVSHREDQSHSGGFIKHPSKYLESLRG